MSQLDVIERMSNRLGVRLRRLTRPDAFAVLRGVVEKFDVFAIEERMASAGLDEDDSAFELDADGNVVSLWLPQARNVTDAVDEFAELDALQFLALDVGDRADALLPTLAKLNSLRNLLLAADTSLGNGMDYLRQMPLEALICTGKLDGFDVAPLATVATLRTLGAVTETVANLGALSACHSLRHLGVQGDALVRENRLSALTQIETLYVASTAPDDAAEIIAEMRGLRVLDAENMSPPIEALARLPELRTIHIEYAEPTLDALTALPRLESLSLESTRVEELTAVRRLPALRRLRMESGALRDLRALAGHPSIEFLDITHSPFVEIPDALALPRLRHLEWKATAASRLTSGALFTSCPLLETATLDGHAIDDLAFLATLRGLRHLSVRGNRITSLEPLAALPTLTTLDVAANTIVSLAPLARSLTLTVLDASENAIEDAQPLSGLTRLEDLSLSENVIGDLAFVKPLRNLYRLNVARNAITSLEPLLGLRNLAHVDVGQNQIRVVPPETIDGLRSLETLRLADNPIDGIERELYNGNGSTTIRALRDYYRGLARGSVRHDHAKLVLVGNGRVGKTSIVTRLIDDVFDAHEPSTHGIQLRRWSLEHVPNERLGDRPLNVDVWDFGGQDIYHATHRLFMRTRALFLLVWDKETENAAFSFDEFNERYEHFPLAYWIDYIKALAGSPVIIVQNKVDTPALRDRRYGSELETVYPPPQGVIDWLYVSARQPDAASGFDALTNQIRDSLASLGSIGLELPAQWVDMRDRLTALASTRHHITFAEFEASCASIGMHDSEAMSLVGFLHDAGIVFYQPKEFGNRLILDQKWAIDAVYALFDRRGAAYRDLRAAGRNGLTLEILERQVWRHFAKDEHALLLEFMKSCELCFEFRPGHFYVPQLLPDDRPSRVGVRWREPSALCLEIQYKFLHRAIIDRFLVRAGRLGADDEPEIWKNGIVIYDADGGGEALVEAMPHERRIRVQARGDNAVDLLGRIRREFEELHKDFPATVNVSADTGAHFVDLAQLRAHAAAGAEEMLDTSGARIEIAPLLPFLNETPNRLPKGALRSAISPTRAPRADADREIFLSYAWKDKREAKAQTAMVDRLHAALVQRGYKVVRDNQDNGYRGLIGDFMRRLGAGRIVVTIISDAYLRSPFCMYELLEIHRNGKFHERVFPIVLDDAKQLYDLDTQLDYMAYWKEKKDKIEAKIQSIGIAAFRTDGALKAYETYYRDVFNFYDTIAAVLADWNALDPEELAEDNFERLVTAIERQIATGSRT